ncbi:MAG TPA: Pls/PosA family non-ribosomal peptide synthetase [Pseudonocardiaceae bacterium]|nr:Pls/PosA family non-ribosomal peptide synthetase [Pseudonocardiaceae bacterium]
MSALTQTDPMASTERALAEVLAQVVKTEQVSVDSHFFDELGADSMVMARFCARVRKREDLPSVSMRDVYRHPTIKSLAAALTPAEPAPAPFATAPLTLIESPPPPPAPIEVATPVSRLQYILCGAVQLLTFLGYSYVAALILIKGYEWISASSSVAEGYLRSVLYGGASFLALCTLPILAKWLLIGRWRQQQIRIWSMAYVRFWIVKTLIRSSPLVVFAGSPLYLLYLRALGAKIGRGVVIFSRFLPVCTDLLTIGDNTVIRKDTYFNCYRAQAGWIQTGPVTFGKNVFVGEATVIDIDTSLGDGAQLGRASSLHAGQAVPAGERWHGSPAERTETDYQVLDQAGGSTLRRALYSVLQLLIAMALTVPLAVGGVALLRDVVPLLGALLDSGPLAFTGWQFFGEAVAASFVLFFGVLLVRLLVMVTVPRVLNLAIKPGKIYPLYGFHYWAHRTIGRLTNSKFFLLLFGDCSYVVHYLRSIGYDLSHVEQTGSNFGSGVKHDNPYLSSVGSGTMVADGLSIINADYSSTSFRVSRTSIGPRNFLGNHIVYPPQGRTGDNCLLATKVMVPVDGDVREGTGLLGSPSMEIPRTVQRDTSFDDLASGDELRRRLSAKNRHNAITIGLFLLVWWIYFFVVTALTVTALNFYDSSRSTAIALAAFLTLPFTVIYFTLVERAVTAALPLRPLFCSIYDLRFWRHERFWKVPQIEYLAVLNGTPFKNVVWRLVGVRIGRRVFDNGCFITERTLTTIGDDVTLNEGSKIQCHSQEDGAFKSDHSTVGAGCTVGVGALVHYGVTMGDGAVLAPYSFLMKGEEMPSRAQWGGNPARENYRAAVVSGK